jgi:lysophospholipase L1-like esterase
MDVRSWGEPTAPPAMPSFMPSSLPLPKALYLVPLLVGCGALVQAATFWHGVRRARAFAAQGRRFERRLAAQGEGPRILILGDSTGVGVGASRPEESIAGLLAADFPDADVVNVSESGAKVADTLRQVRACAGQGLRFDLALLHVGGNDVVRATPTTKLAEDCELLLTELGRLAHRSLWLGPPNLATTPLFTPPFSWVVAARSRAATAIFVECAARHGITFVNFSSPEHEAQFVRARAEHFAADRFHPSSSSYRYGWSVARRAVEFSAFAAKAI